MKKEIENASWIILCRIVQAILALIISMITARYLGPSNFGLLNYAISVVAFVLPVMRLGLTSILVQEFIAEPDKEGETLGTSIIISMISAIVCIIGVNLFVFITNAEEMDTLIVCALYSSVLVFQVFEVFNYWFQSKLQAKYSSIIALIAYGIVSFYKVYLLITKKSIYWFSVANTLDYLIIAIGLYIIYRNKCGQKLTYNGKRARRLLSISKYYIISDLMVVVFAQTDRVMLKSMIDNSATGYYSAAVTCASMTQFIFAAIIDSMRPTIFEGKRVSEDVYKQNLTRLFSIITYLSLIQSILMTILAPIIIRILYGVDYSASVSALQIVVWYTTFSYLGSARNIWILAEGKQKYLWQINLFGALANVFLNAILIPIVGVNGAALASLVTQFLTNVVTGFIFKPIRGVNEILVRGFNPRLFLETFSIVIRSINGRHSNE